MLAAPALRKVVDHGLHRIEGAGTVSPQVGLVGLALARLEHLYRCLVGMQHRVGQHLCLERIDQGLQCSPAFEVWEQILRNH